MSGATTPSDQEPPLPDVMVQVPPSGQTRSLDEMNTGLMVFELQGTVGELKEAIAALTRTVEKSLNRVEIVEHTTGEIKEALRLIVPKLDDFAGFYKHRVPMLPDKSDINKMQTELKLEIEKRPTRRQMILDIGFIVGLIAAAVTFGSRLAH